MPSAHADQVTAAAGCTRSSTWLWAFPFALQCCGATELTVLVCLQVELQENPGLTGSLPAQWGSDGSLAALHTLSLANCSLSGKPPLAGNPDPSSAAADSNSALQAHFPWPMAPLQLCSRPCMCLTCATTLG